MFHLSFKHTLPIGKTASHENISITFSIFRDKFDRSQLKIVGEAENLKECNEIASEFINNSENLFISKEDFDKLMEIWNNLILKKQFVLSPAGSYPETDPEVFDFIKSLKVKAEFQNIQDECQDAISHKLKERIKSEKEMYQQILKEEEESQGSIQEMGWDLNERQYEKLRESRSIEAETEFDRETSRKEGETQHIIKVMEEEIGEKSDQNFRRNDLINNLKHELEVVEQLHEPELSKYPVPLDHPHWKVFSAHAIVDIANNISALDKLLSEEKRLLTMGDEKSLEKTMDGQETALGNIAKLVKHLSKKNKEEALSNDNISEEAKELIDQHLYGRKNPCSFSHG